VKNVGNIKKGLICLGILSKRHAFAGPRRVELHLTNKCNHNCIVCWIRSPYLKSSFDEYYKQELSCDTVLSLIDELYKMGVDIIHISGGGEPLMHPAFWDILCAIKKKRIACRLNTNFSLLDEEGIKKLISCKLDELTASVWAGSPESYAKTHPGVKNDTFLNIANGLKFLADLKQRNKQKEPIVNIYNVICSLNYAEIDEMVAFSKLCGANHCIFSKADLIDGETGMFALSEVQERSVIERLKYWMDKDNFADGHSHLFVATNAYFSQLLCKQDRTYSKNPKFPCYAGWIFSIIEASGNVSFCCKSTAEPIGNIKNDKFSKIWNGADIKQLRKNAVSGNMNFRGLSSATCLNGCDNVEDNMWVGEFIAKS
jgi:MoaA/NifB/PqqE/SkfB family radical SAM enzyme